jgi:hypothetical protein
MVCFHTPHFMRLFLYFFILSNLIMVGCGQQKKQSYSKVSFDNPGPPSCLTSDFYNVSLQSENKKNASRKKNSQNNVRNSFSPRMPVWNFGHTVGVYGGATVAGVGNGNCQIGSAASRSQAYYPYLSSVELKVPIPNDILSRSSSCSGTIVSSYNDGTNKGWLILTAAHCFNYLENFTDRTANGAFVVLGPDVVNSPPLYSFNVKCWQRNPYYHGNPVSNSDVSTVLHDTAWVKVAVTDNTAFTTYTPATIYTGDINDSTNKIQEKVMSGYGMYSDAGAGVSGHVNLCVSTYMDSTYISRGDIVPDGQIEKFNSAAYKTLYRSISKFSRTAFQDYLTVVGPINGAAVAGVCKGDSGGPLYLYTGSSPAWVLAGSTQGSMSFLTPHPIKNYYNSTPGDFVNGSYSDVGNFMLEENAACSDGYAIFTKLANFVPWINASAIQPFSGWDALKTQD